MLTRVRQTATFVSVTQNRLIGVFLGELSEISGTWPETAFWEIASAKTASRQLDGKRASHALEELRQVAATSTQRRLFSPVTASDSSER